MDRIERSYSLPRSLLARFDQDAADGCYVRDQAVAAAVAGFLRLSPAEQVAALDQVKDLYPPRRSGPKRPPRFRKPAELGQAVRQTFLNPDRLIGS